MIEQPTLFNVQPQSAQTKTAQPKTAQTGEQKTQTASVTIAKSLSEALQSTTDGLCIICDDWPTFDPNDRAYFTPTSEKYIEAERLPPEWLALVGKTVCADRTTVGTIADLLEELPFNLAEEWRKLYANSESDEGESALNAFEEAHHIRWYGEGYYLDSENDEEKK